MHIATATADEIGSFSCHAKNSIGDSEKEFVLDVLSPPKFIGGVNEGVLIGSDPFETKIVVLKGKSVTIKCLVSGNPEPTIHWTEESVDGADERSPEIISTNSTLVSA